MLSILNWTCHLVFFFTCFIDFWIPMNLNYYTFVIHLEKNIYLLMIRICIITVLLVFHGITNAQTNKITGKLVDENSNPIPFANIIILNGENQDLVKVETTGDDGMFNVKGLPNGIFDMKITYIGYSDKEIEGITLRDGETKDLGMLNFESEAVLLEAATVTAQRSLVEVKADRMVFNIEGTVNSAGDNSLGLLRKAPGVLVDNNDNVLVLGRTGVRFFVDGKKLPLAGDELANYLKNIPAEQIDHIDIISNPGAKYEAEGNAGIIDIRLKKDKNMGYNGIISATGSQGLYANGNASLSGNYRNKVLNIFGTAGLVGGKRYNEMFFLNEQNGLILDEENKILNTTSGTNIRLGTDFFITKKSTVGFLVSNLQGTGNNKTSNRGKISDVVSPSVIDSILVADNQSANSNSQNTYNLNYVYLDGNKRLNIDFDYGIFKNFDDFDQPNRYYDADEKLLLSEKLTKYETPTDIDIFTFKVDYEIPTLGGKVGFGTKYSDVVTKNTYKFFDIDGGVPILNYTRSNDFDYVEDVYAGYISYTTNISQKVTMTSGLRVEITDATGDLRAYDPDIAEDPVDLNYTDYFPTLGFTYMSSLMNTWSINYGRRINRPDYNVLNPFRIQLSELSFSKGNARLNPEIVNNLELGYTYRYMYNFKLSYSRTTDQITRLIGPDDIDPRAGFISWANLTTQTLYNLNISTPFTVNKWWSLYANASAGYVNNQANYGDEGVVNVQAFTYNFFQQSTFSLPKKWKAEISGWYSGPGVWGGVFRYDPSYSINIGLQRKFLDDKLNFKITANDITYQSGWSGVSKFNGLVGTGRGNYDSRRVTISLSYNFGNNSIKSRKRKTGIESEKKRLGKG